MMANQTAELIECRTYTVEQAGRLLGVGRNQAYEAVRSGTLPSIKIGKRLLVPKAALDRLLSGGAEG
jgi:excisionase family DNA binding protein